MSETLSFEPKTTFVHRIGSYGADSILQHSRETSRSSGILTSCEIGTLYIAGSEVDDSSARFIIPTYSDILSAEASRLDNNGQTIDALDRIQSETLEEFVERGKNHIKMVLEVIGSRALLTSRLKLAEKKAAAWVKSPAGLMVTNPDADEFQGYVGTIDEIEAMRELASYADSVMAVHNHALTVNENDPPTGNYL